MLIFRISFFIYIYFRGGMVHRCHGSVRTSVRESRFDTISVQYEKKEITRLCRSQCVNVDVFWAVTTWGQYVHIGFLSRCFIHVELVGLG